MTPSPAFEIRQTEAEARRAPAVAGAAAGSNVLCVLMQALASPQTSRIVERAGELFIEPVMPELALAA